MADKHNHFDVIIIGGGIAGLWLLNLLRHQGYQAILIEQGELGGGQTLSSQGMIHGGIKYTLAGVMTGAASTIADMPARWRQCLAGQDPVNLKGVAVLADAYYMFSDARLSSKLTTFFGSKAIRGRVTQVTMDAYPPVFRDPAFAGLLYQLQDLVIDTQSLLNHLRAQHEKYILRATASVEKAAGAAVDRISLGNGHSVTAETYVLAAGKGNGKLINSLGLDVSMQLRPLHQVVVKGADLPDLYAHAVTLKSADKPRITFTTHKTPNGNAWYLGGQIAESGVARSDAEQIRFAEKELADLFPWLDFSACDFSTHRIDRAEAGQDSRLRPDTPYVESHGNVIVCWPTKLTLAPMMGDLVLQKLPVPVTAMSQTASLPAPLVGVPPWL